MTQGAFEGFNPKPRKGLISPRANLEKLLQAARASMINGRHTPHCYSAHVPGQGYVNEGHLQSERAEYLRQLDRSVQTEIDCLWYAPAYAEPGYDDPPRGIVFANWNVFPRGLDRILEYAGYAVEWSDEWSTCDGCQKAVRTSPNSYHWSGAYAFVDECTILCHECIADDPSDYLATVVGDSGRCVTETLADKIDLAAAGFTRYAPPDGQYESGWHPGQNDNPRKIVEELKTRGIDPSRALFVQTEQSQFYIGFEVWLQNEEAEE